MDIEEAFRNFIKRTDIAIILINQNVSFQHNLVLSDLHFMVSC